MDETQRQATTLLLLLMMAWLRVTMTERVRRHLRRDTASPHPHHTIFYSTTHQSAYYNYIDRPREESWLRCRRRCV